MGGLMTIQDLGALGELLGSVAVLATLIYLALQTRQNTMAISAQVEGVGITAWQNVNLIGTDLAELLAKDSTVDATANQTQLLSYWSTVLSTVQWQFYQVRRGFLPAFDEAGLAVGLRHFFTLYRSFEDHWEFARELFNAEFVEWVEEQRPKAT